MKDYYIFVFILGVISLAIQSGVIIISFNTLVLREKLPSITKWILEIIIINNIAQLWLVK